MRAIARTGGVLLAAALAAGAGCAANRAVLTQPAANPPAILGGETESEVLRARGDPTRVLTFEDATTGRTVMVWQYDRFLDTNASRETTSITFEGGRVYKVDRSVSARSPDLPMGPDGTPYPRDSAARRDME